MNKAKALFTVGVIVIVAGASALCWYLNDKGLLTPDENVSDVQDSYEAYDDGDNDNKSDDAHVRDPAVENEEPQQKETTTESAEKEQADKENADEKIDDLTALNEFLSTFSSLYFSENSSFSSDSPNEYELLKFAYLYAVVFDSGKGTVTEYFDDEIGAYNGISADNAEKIIDKFFGVSISRKDVYTENTYSFFKYDNGYFYTPAADGVGYENLVIVDSAVINGNAVSVSFTVYSKGVDSSMSSAQAKKKGTSYAEGKAEIVITDGEYKLVYYSLKK